MHEGFDVLEVNELYSDIHCSLKLHLKLLSKQNVQPKVLQILNNDNLKKDTV